MGEVYGLAASTIVWLGVGDDLPRHALWHIALLGILWKSRIFD